MSNSVVPQHNLTNVTDQNDFNNKAAQVITGMQKQMNGNMTFANLNTQTVTVVFRFANIPQLVSHNLNKTGVKFMIMDKGASCDVYHPSNLDTNSKINLGCTVATTVTLLLS
jgi:hypothetical protein